MTTETAQDDAAAGSKMSTRVRAGWIIAAIVAGILTLGFVADQVTASPIVCGSCHSMQPKVEAWETSAHNAVACPSCHEDPRPWYRFPETLAVRSVMLQRDVGSELTSDTVPMTDHSEEYAGTIPDSRCLQCHNPEREVTMRYGTLIDHEEHSRRNNSCVSCHLRTGHPTPDAEKPLLLMEQCFFCHSHEEGAEAGGDCGVCHPAEFEKRPQSHGEEVWQVEHGKSIARPESQECTMCHEKQYCTDCHGGIEMPHPEAWEEGETGHGPVAAVDDVGCFNCHEQEPSFCSACHHESWDPGEGPWVEQHPGRVKERGAAFCLQCHDPLHCHDCHTEPPVTF